MNWEQLLSLKRFGDTQKRLRIEQDETRLGFEVDFDRIIFSDYFRSLQDKTQVIPFSKTDFAHTRLTHSLEVSVVARSLGRTVGKHILQKYPELNKSGYRVNDFGAITAAAALAHDIGNPPFGHSGEKAIGEYFKNSNGKRFKNRLTDKQWQDLIDFEGNANGFKILNQTSKGIEGGLRLSYATLGAFIKYPKESLPKKPNLNVASKKFGVFQSEVPFFNELAKELNLSIAEGSEHFNRHPLAFLVEAADDICYTIIDFEDGINLGYIDESVALEYLINLVKEDIDVKKYRQLAYKKDRISYLRALAIGSLIKEVISLFIENEEAILKGEYKTSLMGKCKFEAQIKDIIKISVANVYNHPEVIEKELKGYRAIHFLLDTFLEALERKKNNALGNYETLVLALLPDKEQEIKENDYEQILAICCYLASLSDTVIFRLYKTLQG